MKAEDWFVYERRLRYWSPMLPKEELAWLRLMAATPITDLVEFEGVAEPFKWRFAHEKMATLLGALA